MSSARVVLVEFPADDSERALRFWGGVLDAELESRSGEQGAGWQTVEGDGGAAVGVHERGKGPGDSFSLPYLAVDDMEAARGRVERFGGTVIHPGERWSICKDSEGNPFALSAGG